MEEQRSKEWFAKRRGRITGSAIGAILGHSPFDKPRDVMRRMVRNYHGAPSEFQGNAATQYGQFHEEYAIADFELATGLKVAETGFHVHPDIPWLGASPDGFVKDGKAVIEVKCPFSKRNEKTPIFKSAKEQPHYYAQMQYEMLCTGTRECYFWQWAQGGSMIETIAFDQSYIDETLPKLEAFYNDYLDQRENNYEVHLEDKVYEIPEALCADEYRLAVEEVEAAKEKLERARAALIKMADGRRAKIGGLSVFETVKKGSVSYSKVVKEHCPDVDLEPYRGKESRYWTIK